jgi:uncharacterized tellurite resistance protein B-like protein
MTRRAAFLTMSIGIANKNIWLGQSSNFLSEEDMGRRRSSGGAGLGLVVLGLIALAIEFVVQHGQTFLIVAGVVGAAWLAYKLFAAKPASSGQASSGASRAAPDMATRDEAQPPVWVDANTNAMVQGRSIGGMVYVGRGLASLGMDIVEPALIDPALPAVRQSLDLSQAGTTYWPSYTTSSAAARGAYLQWLSSGRKDPDAEIGLVFLYFYGLERRALGDVATIDVPATELEAIRAEVQRLLGIYTSGSFQSYARGFLDALWVRSLPSALYRDPAPQTPHFDMSLKVGLAQCAQDGAPLPVDWAIAWLEKDTSRRLPPVASRCNAEFRRLFALRYADNYGAGLILPRNKTKLRFDYHAASASFRGWNRSLAFGFDLPDVTVLTGPVRKLRVIAESCCEDLAGYSRRRTKAGADPDSLECIVELPYALWPDKYRQPVEKIRALVTASGQPLAIPFQTVQKWMPDHTALGKPQWRSFVARLSEAGLGVEPDPSTGGAVPVADARVAFFSLGAEGRAEETSGRYRAAALTLQLAVAVASADGVAQDLDRSALLARLEESLQLAAGEKTRLNAHLRRVLAEAPKITGLTELIKAMDRTARKAVGAFVVSVAEADGAITKAERRMLERIFKLLELAPTSLPAVTPEEPRVVVAAGEPGTGHAIRSPTAPLVLDPIRVRELQAETERVATLLTGIFNAEEESSGSAPEAGDEAAEPASSASGLWGLDAEYSDLAKQLLTRAHWARAELEELAGDRQIMLDGALETINEACLDATGQPLLEGHDPVAVNRDLIAYESSAALACSGASSSAASASR